jgi:hypothetical protein
MSDDQPAPLANDANPANELASLAGLAGGQPLAPRDVNGRFLTGNSGGGRPKGSRNRLTDTFLSAIADDFAANGSNAIEQLRNSDPFGYLRLIGALIPRQLILQREREIDFADMSIDEIEELIERARCNQAQRHRLAAVSF